MFRLKAYSAEEWSEIERRGFAAFLMAFGIDSLVVFWLVFSVLNFLVYFDHQTDLMRTGALSALVLAPISSITVWLAVRKRFRGNRPE